MKKLITSPTKLFLILFLTSVFTLCFYSCSSQVEPTLKYIQPTKTIPQELGQRVFICDSTLNVRDIEISKLKDSLFSVRFKIAKIKYYVKICNKNPKNNVFLKGWINRTIN